MDLGVKKSHALRFYAKVDKVLDEEKDRSFKMNLTEEYKTSNDLIIEYQKCRGMI